MPPRRGRRLRAAPEADSPAGAAVHDARPGALAVDGEGLDIGREHQPGLACAGEDLGLGDRLAGGVQHAADDEGSLLLVLAGEGLLWDGLGAREEAEVVARPLAEGAPAVEAMERDQAREAEVRALKEAVEEL